MTVPRLAAAMLAAQLLFTLHPAQAAEPEPALVSVSGSAEVRVRPDQVILTLGVESLSENLQAAKADNDRKVARVIEVAKAQGIEEKKIETDFLQIQPEYQGRRKLETAPIYVVQRSVVVTLSQIDQFEALLSAALAAGANYVHGIEFRTTQLRAHRDEARRKAVQAAKDKAALLAGELGLTVGPARRIQEGRGGWWSTYGRGWGGGRYGFASQNVSQAGGQGGAESDAAIAPGQIAVTAQVSVTFELR